MQGGWSKGMSMCMVGGPRVCVWWVVQGAESVYDGWSKGLSLCMVGGPRG